MARLASVLSVRSAGKQSAEAAPNVRIGPYVFSAAVSYARDISPHGIRGYPPGFVHVRGAPAGHAIASAPFRDPPDWAEVADQSVAGGASRLQPIDVWSEAMLLTGLWPVRVRRQLRRWRSQFLGQRDGEAHDWLTFSGI